MEDRDCMANAHEQCFELSVILITIMNYAGFSFPPNIHAHQAKNIS